jgi:hypothetical protein
VAALIVAAVIGISGGGLTAFFMQPEEVVYPDPLGLGIDLVNVDCTGEAILIVGRGNDPSDLRDSVVDFDTEGAQYLEQSESCDTAYPNYEGAPAKYAVYLAGYSSMEEACEVRMRNDHKDDVVTRMKSGNEDAVVCPCVMDRNLLPEIGGEGLDVTTESVMWTYLYQSMLLRAGFLESPKQLTGEFDEDTIYATRRLQTDTRLPADAKVTTDTWVQLRTKACRLYDY